MVRPRGKVVNFLMLTVTLLTGVTATVGQMGVAEGQPKPPSPMGIEVIGPREWLVGSTGALRVIVTDFSTGRAVAGALVRIELKPTEGEPARLFEGRADYRGTVRPSFTIPEVAPGSYELIISARSRGLTEETRQPVILKRVCQVLLTTDKPIYQPAQVIHIRALALKRPHLEAVAGRDITLEVADPKGNKVFKRVTKTNQFGVAWADFQLADEVNLGSYEVRALLDDGQATKTVTVKRYVLPKFKVAVSTDRAYYLPGEQVKGKVQADYFFGKPVSDGQVTVSVKTFDVEFTEIQQIQGKTDEHGTFEFECRLPDHFVGQPLEQGQAFLQFEVKVTDQAEHSEQAIHTSTVAASHLAINAVAESGQLVPGVENLVYVMTSRPSGEPAESLVRVEGIEPKEVVQPIARRDYRTDALGIAEIPLRLKDAAEEVTLKLAARLADGTVARKTVVLNTDTKGTDNLLLRMDKPLARVGEPINATALCSAKSGTVYFDVIKDRQTMLTAAADISDGCANISLRPSPEISGTLYLSAYRISPDGQIIRDTRPLFVQPADELNIAITADKDIYQPGGEAKLAFAVSDREGRPVGAALGINVVDESVFALQELQPGMEKVFFYLEQELMKPRYEIHGFELPDIIAKAPSPELARDEATTARAAKVIFASVEVPELNTFQVNTYAERLAKAKTEWVKQMEPLLERIQRAIAAYQQQHEQPLPFKGGVELLFKRKLLTKAQLKDLWGHDVILKPASWNDKDMYWAIVVSLGPDGKAGTLDDLIMASTAPGAWFPDEATAGRARWRRSRDGVAWGMGGAEGAVFDMAVPLAAPAEAVVKSGAPPVAAESGMEDLRGARNGGEKTSVRVREYFPETMFVEPSLITDETGKATLTIPIADSITTWRLAAVANSAGGQLGSTTQGLRCFQDFFVDIDLPVSLTQNDQVSIPIAVYNYLPDRQTVRLELAKEDWFELVGEPQQSLEIAGNDVDVRYFTLKVKQIGNHPLTVHAYGSQMSDAVKRVVEVVPDGKQVEVTANGRLQGTVEEAITIPEGAIADASTIFVKIYPGIFSQIVEGLDSILQMPFGCFEQTSSTTWPNVLVLDYMKATKQITPEIQMKAEGFINAGYQRMLSYEVPGGGFSWFGNPPANKLLTAYGLMEFHDMSAVYQVDPHVISRTQQWLLSQADEQGIFSPDKEYLHQETWGKLQVENLLPTSYVVWALTHTGCKDPRLEKSVAYVRANWAKAKEPYSLAVVANALVGADALFHDGSLSDATRSALRQLLGMAKTKGDQMWWESEVSTITYSSGQSANIEATGLAALALMRSGLYGAEVPKVLNFLIASKDPRGTWHSTNATILALRALVMAQKNATQKANGEVTVTVNGQQVSGFAITPQDADVVRVIDCRPAVKPGPNKVRVQFAGEGSTLYQIVGRFYMPWKQIGRPAQEPLSITLDYDKTSLKQDDTVTAKVSVKNNTLGITSMIIVDLGIPPGFSVDPGDFAELVGAKKISRYNMTGRQVIVYVEKLDPGQELTFSYVLKAKFPLKAKTPKSTAYEYYNPDNRADAKPIEMEVAAK